MSNLGVKFIKIEQDNGSQLFVQPLREDLKAREAEVEYQQVQIFFWNL